MNCLVSSENESENTKNNLPSYMYRKGEITKLPVLGNFRYIFAMKVL